MRTQISMFWWGLLKRFWFWLYFLIHKEPLLSVVRQQWAAYINDYWLFKLILIIEDNCRETGRQEDREIWQEHYYQRFCSWDHHQEGKGLPCRTHSPRFLCIRCHWFMSVLPISFTFIFGLSYSMLCSGHQIATCSLIIVGIILCLCVCIHIFTNLLTCFLAALFQIIRTATSGGMA